MTSARPEEAVASDIVERNAVEAEERAWVDAYRCWREEADERGEVPPGIEAFRDGFRAGAAWQARAAIAQAASAPVSAQAVEPVVKAFRNVDDEDWDFLLKQLGFGGRHRFWRAVLEEVRVALANRQGQDEDRGDKGGSVLPADIADVLTRCAGYGDDAGVSIRMGSLRSVEASLAASGGTAEAVSDAEAEAERLRFEGNLDGWMKVIGAGISGFQPEAYAVMDAACRELVELRASTHLLKHGERFQSSTLASTAEVEALRSIAEGNLGDAPWQANYDRIKQIARAALSAPPASVPADGWQTMESAPKDGRHCILAVEEGAFVYSVQGAWHNGQWDAVHRDNVHPLYWMPNKRLPEGWLELKRSAPPALSAEGEA